MKVLLLNPPYVHDFMRSARWAAVSISGSNWYPIYLAYCTGLLEKYGHQTKLIDGTVGSKTHDDVYRIVKQFSPDICVIYTSTLSLDNDIAVSAEIKKLTGSYIVFVGPWCSIHPQKILEKATDIDALAVGEFDYTILELADEKSKKAINGLAWRNSQSIILNPPRQPLSEEQINEFPFVTDVYRRHLNIYDYFQAPHMYPFIDMFIGRGCPWGKCTFCLWPHTINYGAPYRERSMENAIAEVNYIKKELSYIKELFIQDDTLSKKRALEFSEALLENDIDITWSCYSRADLDIETLRLMKKSGCRLLHVGYESSNPEILKNINKGLTVQTMEQFTENVNTVGLLNHADFIIGLPGETLDTIKATIAWAKTLKVDSYQFTIPKPYPETPFYDYLEKNGFLKDGMANYPHLSAEEIEKWTLRAIKETNLNPRYLFRMLCKPREWKRLMRSGKFVVPKVLK